jgi:hypothetical protein
MTRAFQCSRVCVYLAVLTAVIGWTGWASADTANLIPNGDFATGLSGWTGAGGTPTWLDSGASTSPDGPSASITGAMWLYQPTFNTVPALVEGTTYRASFKAALLAPGSDPDNAILRAEITTAAGAVTRPLMPVLDSTWREYSLNFTADAADVAANGYRISFLSGYASQNGLSTSADQVFGIDSVSLASVPEPSTLALLGAGLTGLLAYAWRKRR